MMSSIAPFWDGNETWLVLGGGGLLVAFPRAYAMIMPALYLPVIVMLLALVFRGVAFEFRAVAAQQDTAGTSPSPPARRSRRFCQGVILGGLIQGITVENGAFAGGAFDWATPFALLCGARRGRRLCAARRDLAGHEDRRRGRRARARAGQDAAARGAGLHGGGEPVDAARRSRASRERWFSLPNFFFLWPVPLVTALIALMRLALRSSRAATCCRSSPRSRCSCSAISGS